MFVCYKGFSGGMPTLPEESDSYLQSSPSVVSPIHELPCRGHIGGLGFNNLLIYFINPTPGQLICKGRWMVRRCWFLWLRRMVISSIGYLQYFLYFDTLICPFSTKNDRSFYWLVFFLNPLKVSGYTWNPMGSPWGLWLSF